ncbi:MAG: restriction endonuclease subunit S [Polyangiaceae bacterium]
MTVFTDVAVGDLFEGRNGRAVFVKDYLDKHPGDYPVYSASLERPFGFVDTFDYDGTYLTWVMNGYGGRVREATGKFSANRDRGVLVPRDGVKIPDHTYLRYAMEPVFVAAAVGRRVDGRRNDYTKLYPEEATAQRIQIPVDKRARYDYAKMEELGSRLRRIETAQAAVRRALEDVLAARVTIESLVSSDDAP